MLPSSCNLFPGVGAGAGTFSMFFGSCENDEQPQAVERYGPWTSAVDCTLSLGTPSTSSQSHSTVKSTPPLDVQHQQQDNHPLRWDFTSYLPKQRRSSAATAVSTAATLGAGASSGRNSGGDPVLLARRCANCDTTSTPLWRNGPKGPKSLCNACGIRYKKEKRREASFAVTCPSSSLSSPGRTLPTATHLDLSSSQPPQQRCEVAYVYEQYRCGYPATRQARKAPSPADAMEVAALPGIPWWLNVPIPQRAVEYYAPGFLEDYT
ncbi:hypothetical protein Taro_030293 [Colocasia esculenta]|uniref:GATA-type domain-containing protein n=1 Tax=Colocasia esculenta TaxID=4460 RepID=A0A843VTP0_COLES|nr:hypothetical protein [Colocasia esculenta]